MSYHVDTAPIIARQELDPLNRDDAEYLVAHGSCYPAEMVDQAHATLDAVYAQEQS